MTIFILAAFAFLLVGEPWLEAVAYKRFMRDEAAQGGQARLRMYRAAFFRTAAIGLAIAAAVAANGARPAQLGFGPLDMSGFSQWPLAVRVVVFVLLALYATYNLLPIVVPMFGEDYRQEVSKRLEYVIHITPVGRSETAWWFANSLNSATEEFVYRGFVFYAMLLLWPSAPVVALIVVSSLLDCARYAHRVAAALNVFLTGVVFCVLFLMFHSIWIAMLAHFLHDVRVLGFPLETVRRNVAARLAREATVEDGAVAAA